MIRWIKKLFKPVPLDGVEQYTYDRLTKMGFAAALKEVQAGCDTHYNVTVGNRGVRKWISEHAKEICVAKGIK